MVGHSCATETVLLYLATLFGGEGKYLGFLVPCILLGPFKFNSSFRLFFNFVISVQLNIFLNLDRVFWKFRNGRGRLAKGVDVECDSLTVRDDGAGGMICRFENALTDGQFLVEQLVVVWDGGRIGMLLDAS